LQRPKLLLDSEQALMKQAQNFIRAALILRGRCRRVTSRYILVSAAPPGISRPGALFSSVHRLSDSAVSTSRILYLKLRGLIRQ